MICPAHLKLVAAAAAFMFSAAALGEPPPIRSRGLSARQLAFTPDGRWLASLDASGRLELWKVPGVMGRD